MLANRGYHELVYLKNTSGTPVEISTLGEMTANAHQTARTSTSLGMENQELVEQKPEFLSKQAGTLKLMESLLDYQKLAPDE